MDTYIKAPAVAHAGTINANGEKNTANKKNNPMNTAVNPVLQNFLRNL
jgi:hypothetical protein